MKCPQLATSLFALLFAFLANSLYADEKHDDHKHEDHAHEGHEQHGTHEHGVANLSIAVGDESVEIMLQSPAANIVGFEHAASSDEDKQKLADAKAKLEAGSDLFAINDAAGCELKSTTVVSALSGHAEEHAHEHDGEKHDEHEHKEGGVHSDMDATWVFTCAKPADVTEVSVKLFGAFPAGFEQINTEWITAEGASAQELSEDTTLKLN